jgi:hypothetical protein
VRPDFTLSVIVFSGGEQDEAGNPRTERQQYAVVSLDAAEACLDFYEWISGCIHFQFMFVVCQLSRFSFEANSNTIFRIRNSKCSTVAIATINRIVFTISKWVMAGVIAPAP